MKKVLFSFIGIIILLTGVGVAYLLIAYPDVDSPPNIEVKGSPQQVARGKYLAEHVSACIDCHSTRNWSRFAAPITEGTYGKGGDKFGEEMGLPGTFYAQNITPHNLGSWTDGEVYRVITSGVTKSGRALFPLMPYKSYSRMDPDDVKAIVAYLRTLDPIEYQAPASEVNFPMSLIIPTIPESPDPIERPSPEDSIAYGKYMTIIAACTECHTPKSKGQPMEGMFLAGGFEYDLPFGTIRSSNITPHEQTGIGRWTKERFVDRFKQYDVPADSLQNVAPDEFNTIMPWKVYAGMTKQDLEAIYTYLQTVEPVEHKVEQFTPASE